MFKKVKKDHIIEVAKIIKGSKLDRASFINSALAPVEYDMEVLEVAEKIVKYFKKIK